MSVTTIMGLGIPKPELASWSAYETARAAIQHAARLATITDYQVERKALDWLITASDRIRDEAGRNGSVVHDYIEALLLGRGSPETPPGEYIAAFNDFMAHHQPRVRHAEIVVASLRDGWAGRVDAYLSFPRHGELVVDWKTSRKPRDTYAMQLAAYRRADRAWLDDGTEIDPPETEGGVVVHIRPEKYRGGWRMFEADTSHEVYQAFLAARDVARLWTSNNKPRLSVMRG